MVRIRAVCAASCMKSGRDDVSCVEPRESPVGRQRKGAIILGISILSLTGFTCNGSTGTGSSIPKFREFMAAHRMDLLDRRRSIRPKWLAHVVRIEGETYPWKLWNYREVGVN